MLKYWGIAAVAILAIGWSLLATKSGSAEPVYAGKTVDQWLEAGYEDAATALHEIGTPAVPFILNKLSREDPRSGTLLSYHLLLNRLPQSVKKILPKPKTGNFDELRACSDLLEVGPQAIPFLTAQLRHPNPLVREVSAHALGSLQRQGKNISRSVPMLIEAAQDPNPQVRSRAAWALESNLPQPERP